VNTYPKLTIYYTNHKDKGDLGHKGTQHNYNNIYKTGYITTRCNVMRITSN